VPQRERLAIWTIGHSTRSLEEFIVLLQVYGVEAVADVRRFAGSRKYPHFNPAPLAEGLAAAGLAYAPLPALGGRRVPRPDSPNIVWRNASFRGYADYMETPQFEQGLQSLGALARAARTAVMCAEAVWWRCHRALIADRLTADGHAVRHILSAARAEPHPYTAAARLLDGRLSYSAGEPARKDRKDE
jgi:uncharacterized protein (DUF488 family)